MFDNKVISIGSPLWQCNVVNSLFLLSHSKVMLFNIEQKLRHVKKLREKLADVRYFTSYTFPT